MTIIRVGGRVVKNQVKLKGEIKNPKSVNTVGKREAECIYRTKFVVQLLGNLLVSLLQSLY